MSGAEAVLERPRREASGELVVLTKSPEERIAELEEKVASLEPRRGSMRAEDWEVKENHAEIRRRVYLIIDKVLAMNYHDVVMDEWIPAETHINSSIQWTREVRQFLVKSGTRHYPPREPGQEPLREVLVPGRGRPASYLGKASVLHCVIERAVSREHVSDKRRGQVIRRLREELGAMDETKCSRCGPILRGEISTP